MHAGGFGVGFLPPGVYKTWVLLVCLFFGSRPLGVDWLGHYLLDHWEESMAVHNTTFIFGNWVCYGEDISFGWKPYMLAFVGQPSLRGYYACMIFCDKGALRRNCKLKKCETSISPYWVFSV